MAHISPSFSATLRLRLEDAPGTFARVAEAISEAGGSLGAIDIVTSIVYAVVMPYVSIVLALLFFDLRDQSGSRM